MDLIPGSESEYDAFMKLSWCLRPEELAELKRREVVEPMLLLITYYVDEGGKFTEVRNRQIVPIAKQGMTYVAFRRPGHHRLLAFVVWAGRDWTHSHQVLPSMVMERGYQKYLHFLDQDGVLNRHWHTELTEAFRGVQALTENCCALPQLDVEIDAEFFAKKPHPALARWVNWPYDSAPKDSCAFWQRLVFFAWNYHLAMFILIYSARLVVAGYYLLWGMRKINFQPLTQPLSGGTRYIYADCSRKAFWGSVFFKTKKGDDLPLFINALTPAPYVLLAASSLVVALIVYLCGEPRALTFVPLIIGGVVGIMGLLFGLGVIIELLAKIESWLAPNIEAWRQRKKDAKLERECTKAESRVARAQRVRQTEAEAAKEHLVETYDLLERHVVCNGHTPPTTVKDVPAALRNVKLRLMALKAGHNCRPYAP